jgi:hypothetical protein
MSRYSYCDYDDGDVLASFHRGAWEHSHNRALNSKRGLKVLREFEQALLALPVPRLICNEIVKDGEVCAIGAYAKYKGCDLTKYEPGLCGWCDNYDCDCSDTDLEMTASLGKEAGMARTMAWDFAYMNDEVYSGTPEERWTKTIERVRRLIASHPDVGKEQSA